MGFNLAFNGLIVSCIETSKFLYYIGTCVAQSGSRTDSSAATSAFPCQYFSTIAP